MGNCTATRLLPGDDDQAVLICRDRKKLIKAAVRRRYALADAHSAYAASLLAVSTSLNNFITRHSSPAPLLITLPSSSSSLCSDEPPEEEKESELECGFFYPGTTPPPAPEGGFGWDFFDPFRVVEREEMEEEMRVVREEEGIPELEEEDGRMEEVVEVEKEEEEEEEKGLTVVEKVGKERQLLEALRNVEDQFVRAYDAGKEVGRMLEVSTRAPVGGGLEEIKENSSKIIQAITWHRSPSSQSSCRSFMASSSRSTSWAESKSDVFDDYSGMESGSHSQTLGRLYAWEKKLYQEVKAGDDTRKIYERKCSLLRNHDAKGTDSKHIDKTRAAAKELYTRIFVAIRTAETISNRIQKLKDEELQPQLVELLKGLMENWKIMHESHETQKQIMSEVTDFTCPIYGKLGSDMHRFATLQLETEIQNWRACFVKYVNAQKSYVEALEGWLLKFLAPEVQFFSRASTAPSKIGAPTLFVICHDWLDSLRRLPDRAVGLALKGLSRDLKLLWLKQGEEQHQRRKVDTVAKEFDRRVVAFQKTENRILESKLSEHNDEPDVLQRMEYLTGRKDLLNMCKERLEQEKTKHHESMQEIRNITLNGLKRGLSGVFESLEELSKNHVRMYDELLKYNENTKMLEDDLEKPSCIEGKQADVDHKEAPLPISLHRDDD